jgi:TatA/E family protein of Tat protein translocase
MNLFGMGTPEILVIMVVALIIFGPGKLPEIGAQVGKAVRDFRRATSDLTSEFQSSIDDVQSTVGDMKQTMADVQKETQALASSIPASIESSASARPASSTKTKAATAVSSAPTPQDEPVAVASKTDPLADFGEVEDTLEQVQPTEHAS